MCGRLELANDYAELGAVYNGFSLNESGALANAIEKIGQAVDTSYTETAQMVMSYWEGLSKEGK